MTKTLLIVDDEPINLLALTAVLKSRGIKCITAKDGIEALKILNELSGIEIVLMDIMMPVMDGYETIREIRKHEKLKDIPVIALTAKAMIGDRKKCLEAGANDYISKPVDITLLESILAKYQK